MRAAQISAYGGPDVLKIVDVPVPSPGPGEVLVKVAAAGVNPVDWKIREGYLAEAAPLTFPATLGNDAAGTIEALGADVQGLSIGDAVFGSPGITGGFAEFALLKVDQLARVPNGMSLVVAAALPVAAATATVALDTAEVKAGTRLLVHAAAGSVGSLAIQLAKARGAHVTAVTSRATQDHVRGLGADIALVREEDWATQAGQMDVVLDGVGGATQEASWPVLAKGGILVSLVQPPSEEHAQALGVRGRMVFGHPTAEALGSVAALVASGQVQIPIAGEYSLDAVSEALAVSQSGEVVGKLVVKIG
jgi:NADPH:quinone reductase-like Zn-dependent oxidoreductase